MADFNEFNGYIFCIIILCQIYFYLIIKNTVKCTIKLDIKGNLKLFTKSQMGSEPQNLISYDKNNTRFTIFKKLCDQGSHYPVHSSLKLARVLNKLCNDTKFLRTCGIKVFSHIFLINLI